MNSPLRILTSALGALALIAAPAFAQETAPPKDKPLDAKVKTGKDAAAKDLGAKNPAAQEGAAKSAPGAGGARANKDVLKPVAFEEARYRKRLAQLERIEQIATEKQNAKMLAEVAELRLKNDEHHAKRDAKLRSQHGDEKVDAALAFLEKHGKGKPVKPPKNAKAREAMKDQTGDKADAKIKDVKKDADKAREKAKDKPDQKPE